MELTTVQDWIAWAGLVLPLSALAWGSCFYILTQRRELQHREFERSFKVMDHLVQANGSIASKMAAAFELKRYPEYGDVIIRFCEKARIEGSAAEMLRDEMDLTANLMRGGK